MHDALQHQSGAPLVCGGGGLDSTTTCDLGATSTSEDVVPDAPASNPGKCNSRPFKISLGSSLQSDSGSKVDVNKTHDPGCRLESMWNCTGQVQISTVRDANMSFLEDATKNEAVFGNETPETQEYNGEQFCLSKSEHEVGAESPLVTTQRYEAPANGEDLSESMRISDDEDDLQQLSEGDDCLRINELQIVRAVALDGMADNVRGGVLQLLPRYECIRIATTVLRADCQQTAFTNIMQNQEVKVRVHKALQEVVEYRQLVLAGKHDCPKNYRDQVARQRAECAMPEAVASL